MSKVKKLLKINNIANNKKASLALLKEKALNADLNVLILTIQKLISKKEVIPISSQPKKRETKLAEDTKKIMLIINKFKNIINLSTLGSYLK